MNKIPKFRAWYNGQMWRVFEIGYEEPKCEKINMLVLNRYDDKDELIDSVVLDEESINEVKIMMSSGLYDINGVEIFEGDVLSSDMYHHNMFKVKYGEFSYNHNITINTGFYLELVNPFHVIWISQSVIKRDKFEIFGNIYCNLELIKIPNTKQEDK